MPAHKENESIEGLKIKGHSRDPLRTKSIKLIEGVKYCQFKAEFNVSAEVDIEIPVGTTPIFDDALTDKNENLRCDSAIMTAKAKNNRPAKKKDFFGEIVSSAVSHKHGATRWESRQQTNVRIVTPDQKIVNSIENRNKIH